MTLLPCPGEHRSKIFRGGREFPLAFRGESVLKTLSKGQGEREGCGVITMGRKNHVRDLFSKEKGFFYFGVFAVVLVAGLIISRGSTSRPWYIKADGTGDAPTIQADVDSAAAIFVHDDVNCIAVITCMNGLAALYDPGADSNSYWEVALCLVLRSKVPLCRTVPGGWTE